VRWLAEAAPDVVRWLLTLGVQFDTVKGRLALGREAAHSFPRVLHAGGDATGAELMRVMRDAVLMQPWIQRFEFCDACELLKHGPNVVGVVVRNRHGEFEHLMAGNVVLATGGMGQLYRYTSNPPEANGSGLALAYHAGADFSDMEFVQFHPTALAPDPESSVGQLPLVTEGLRGAGAILVNDLGARFMTAAHAQLELAPRDVLARAVADQISKGHRVFLDARALGDSLRTRFPVFVQNCAARGLDPRAHLIPVVPAAHYHMGGIKVDLHSLSRVPGLYAVGEVACTGVHGANRLASNSLLESIAFGRALGERLAQRGPGSIAKAFDPPAGHAVRPSSANDSLILGRLRQLMWAEVGILRTIEGLHAASQQIQVLERRCLAGAPVLRELLVARIIVDAALRRRESIGAHFLDVERIQAFSGNQAVA